jgi:hypothetical protein
MENRPVGRFDRRMERQAMPSKTPRVIVGLFFAACATVVCAVSAWPVVHSASAVIAGIAAGFALVLRAGNLGPPTVAPFINSGCWHRTDGLPRDRAAVRLTDQACAIAATQPRVVRRPYQTGRRAARGRPRRKPPHRPSARVSRTRGLAEHRSAISLRSLN